MRSSLQLTLNDFDDGVDIFLLIPQLSQSAFSHLPQAAHQPFHPGRQRRCLQLINVTHETHIISLMYKVYVSSLTYSGWKIGDDFDQVVVIVMISVAVVVSTAVESANPPQRFGSIVSFAASNKNVLKQQKKASNFKVYFNNSKKLI